MLLPARLQVAVRRCLLALLVILATACTPSATTPPNPDEVANVAAFARVYGVARYFYPGDAAQTIDWNRFAVHGVAQVRASRTPADLARTLNELFAPVAAGVQVTAAGDAFAAFDPGADKPQVAWIRAGYGKDPIRESSLYVGVRTNRPLPPDNGQDERLAALKKVAESQAARPGRVAEVALPRELKARVRLSLPEAYAAQAEDVAATAALRTKLDAIGPPDTGHLDVRVADVVVAWNVFRHFYPYWAEIGVDADAQLTPLVGAALATPDRAAYDKVLRGLAEQLRDGHASVYNAVPEGSSGHLPIRLAPLDGGWVVRVSAIPERIAVGDVVQSVDGTDVRTFVAERERRYSGSPQWKASLAARMFAVGPHQVPVKLRLEGAHGAYDATLKYDTVDALDPTFNSKAVKRPAPIAELAPGIWYVDLTRATKESLAPQLATVAAAKATIFDVRGYPTDIGVAILPHLLTAPEHGRWMHVPIFIEPFAKALDYEHHGWDLEPKTPHFDGARYVLMDGSAISYAESVLGYFSDLRLATTIGSASAGANGDINPFETPGGANLMFTGMRVTRHDGSSQHHLVGVRPQIEVQQTAEALRAGRDLVLERALELAGAADQSKR